MNCYGKKYFFVDELWYIWHRPLCHLLVPISLPGKSSLNEAIISLKITVISELIEVL